MEPRIQYAKTSDGVNIAYWTMGEGEPLVYMPLGPFSHIQVEWQWPAWRHYYERLAEQRTLIRYDGRGTGLSERDVSSYSLDARILDLEGVVERLGLERFALWGFGDSGPVAIAYAARFPERVSHLVLWGTWAKPSDPAWTEAIDELVEKDWEMGTETLAHGALGWSAAADARRLAALMRECVTPGVLLASLNAANEFDVTDLLGQVRSPTLVLHRRQFPYPEMEVARGLASGIPGSQLVVLEGESVMPFLGDMESVASTIDEFLGDSQPPETEPQANLPQAMTAILFLDIADSTALTTKLGDAAYREKERALDATLRSTITDAGGTPVEGKVLGDGVMAVFTSARQAIDAAQRCRDLGNDAGLPLHLGIHAGDVIREGNNVHGGAVQVAARVQAAAAPGEILVSATVRDLARTSAGVAFEDRGEHELKGIAEPQRLFAVRAEGSPQETAG